MTICSDYKNHLKVCEYLGKPPTGKYAPIKEFSDRIWKDLSFTLIPAVTSRWHITAHKDHNIFFTVDIRTGEVTCDTERTVHYLTGHLGMDVRQAGDLMGGIIKEHLLIDDLHVTRPNFYSFTVRTGPSIGVPY